MVRIQEGRIFCGRKNVKTRLKAAVNIFASILHNRLSVNGHCTVKKIFGGFVNFQQDFLGIFGHIKGHLKPVDCQL